MRGFIVTTVPKGQAPTPDNLTISPALAESEEAFLQTYAPEDRDVVGLTSLELLQEQIQMINRLAAQHGEVLHVIPRS